jgi:hypothetical protein
MKAAANRPQSRRTTVATVADASGWGAFALWLILALMALAWSLPAQAGSLDVLPAAAAQSTDYGLRVEPGTTCSAANDLNITSASISGPYQACNSITAGVDTTGGVKTTGDTTFTAGDEIVLKNKFTVDAGDAFTAIISSPLTQWAYVQDNSPAAEKTYNASFYLNVNSLDFNDNTSDRLHHFVGYSSDGTPHFRVVLRFNSANGGEKRLVLEAREDGGNWESTEGVSEVMLPAGYNKIEINWSAGSGTGQFQVALNDGSFGGLTGLSNSGAQIDHIKWGAVAGTIDAITGTLDIDEFSSWR